MAVRFRRRRVEPPSENSKRPRVYPVGENPSLGIHQSRQRIFYKKLDKI